MKIENVGTKYFLHDCVIDKIEIKDSNIIFIHVMVFMNLMII